MKDIERAEKALDAVHISTTTNGDEYYRIGYTDVTDIKWGLTSGHMAALQTIQVFINGQLHSEHPFSNVLSVYYKTMEK